MDIKKFDLSTIYTRPDGSYIINQGLYHVPHEGEWSALWAEVDAYAKAHPEAVTEEPTPPEPTPEEVAAQELAQAKMDRAEAVARITVTVDGLTFDGDEASQTRMGRTIAAAVALGADLSAEKRTWVLADNSIAEVTIAQLAEALRLAGDAQTALWTVPYQDA